MYRFLSISRITPCSIAGSKTACSTPSKTYGTGCIAFSPLAQVCLRQSISRAIPDDARATREGSLDKKQLSDANLGRIRSLNAIAEKRGQTLAQMAIAWSLRDPA